MNIDFLLHLLLFLITIHQCVSLEARAVAENDRLTVSFDVSCDADAMLNGAVHRVDVSVRPSASSADSYLRQRHSLPADARILTLTSERDAPLAPIGMRRDRVRVSSDGVQVYIHAKYRSEVTSKLGGALRYTEPRIVRNEATGTLGVVDAQFGATDESMLVDSSEELLFGFSPPQRVLGVIVSWPQSAYVNESQPIKLALCTNWCSTATDTLESYSPYERYVPIRDGSVAVDYSIGDDLSTSGTPLYVGARGIDYNENEVTLRSFYVKAIVVDGGAGGRRRRKRSESQSVQSEGDVTLKRAQDLSAELFEQQFAYKVPITQYDRTLRAQFSDPTRWIGIVPREATIVPLGALSSSPLEEAPAGADEAWYREHHSRAILDFSLRGERVRMRVEARVDPDRAPRSLYGTDQVDWRAIVRKQQREGDFIVLNWRDGMFGGVWYSNRTVDTPRLVGRWLSTNVTFDRDVLFRGVIVKFSGSDTDFLNRVVNKTGAIVFRERRLSTTNYRCVESSQCASLEDRCDGGADKYEFFPFQNDWREPLVAERVFGNVQHRTVNVDSCWSVRPFSLHAVVVQDPRDVYANTRNAECPGALTPPPFAHEGREARWSGVIDQLVCDGSDESLVTRVRAADDPAPSEADDGTLACSKRSNGVFERGTVSCTLDIPLRRGAARSVALARGLDKLPSGENAVVDVVIREQKGGIYGNWAVLDPPLISTRCDAVAFDSSALTPSSFAYRNSAGEFVAEEPVDAVLGGDAVPIAAVFVGVAGVLLALLGVGICVCAIARHRRSAVEAPNDYDNYVNARAVPLRSAAPVPNGYSDTHHAYRQRTSSSAAYRARASSSTRRGARISYARGSHRPAFL